MHIWKTRLFVKVIDVWLSSFNDIGVRSCIEEVGDVVLVKILDVSLSCPTASALIYSTLLLFFKIFIFTY